MIKSIVTFSCVFTISFLSCELFSQNLHLELKSITTNRVRKVYKNELVIIYTEHKKYKGLIKINDKKSISVNGIKIKIDDIIKIEKIKSKVDLKTNKK